MIVDDVLNQAVLDNTKKALQSAVFQIEHLYGLLEAYIDSDIVEKMRDDFMAKIEAELKGSQ